MRCVGKVNGVGPELQPDPFGNLELTGQAQVHVEISGTAKRIATGVSEGHSSPSGEPDRRVSKCRWVEVVTTEVGLRTCGPWHWRLAAGQMKWGDEVRRLGRAIRSQGTPVPGYGERQASHHAHGRANLPAAEYPTGKPFVGPALSLAERHIQHPVNLDVVGPVESCGRVVLLPERRIREKQEVQFFVVRVVERSRPGPDGPERRPLGEPARNLRLQRVVGVPLKRYLPIDGGRVGLAERLTEQTSRLAGSGRRSIEIHIH